MVTPAIWFGQVYAVLGQVSAADVFVVCVLLCCYVVAAYELYR